MTRALCVVGGTYFERCAEPRWDQLFGSGLRAAAACSRLVDDVSLSTLVGRDELALLEGYAETFGIRLEHEFTPKTLSFRYTHALAEPRIQPPLHLLGAPKRFEVDAEAILRFGMLEGDPVTRGCRVVYDPQSAWAPVPYASNGSTADTLAVVLNRAEARLLGGSTDPTVAVGQLLNAHGAQVVVLKEGALGAAVYTPSGMNRVPAFKTDRVFPIGSGDVFSSIFAANWAVEHQDPLESALRASEAVAWYVNSRQLPLPDATAVRNVSREAVATQTTGQPRIYLAGPFFSPSQRWLVEEIRRALLEHGATVFSPFHDVGLGAADEVVGKDIDGISGSTCMLALVDGLDPGTIFEVGFARALEIPVVVLSESSSSEETKMLVGTGCRLVDDMVSAVYHSIWMGRR